jgi:hypothetical protein
VDLPGIQSCTIDGLDLGLGGSDSGAAGHGVGTGLVNRDWNYFGGFWMSAVIPAACLIPVWFSWHRWTTIKKAASEATTSDYVSSDPGCGWYGGGTGVKRLLW